MDTCYHCKRPGHWARDCPRIPCDRCGARMDWHTPDPPVKPHHVWIMDCAWRGGICVTCHYPPHRDGAPGRCPRYAHPADSQMWRDLRLANPRPTFHETADAEPGALDWQVAELYDRLPLDHDPRGAARTVLRWAHTRSVAAQQLAEARALRAPLDPATAPGTG